MRTHTDAQAVRFFHSNERICDYAHPDEHAGLHKHAVEMPDNLGIIVCVCCGRTREVRQEDADKWYVARARHGDECATEVNWVIGKTTRKGRQANRRSRGNELSRRVDR